MSSYSEQAKELVQQRLQQQKETNQQISSMISETRNDTKKYLPYGPILMNIYDKSKNDTHHSALLSNIQYSKKTFCDKKCNGKESCLTPCQNFFNLAVNYGLDHFQKVHKYAYAPTVKSEEQ